MSERNTIEPPEFTPFPKIGRLNRTVMVTEKIDGTNGQILIPEDDGPIWAGSRNRWITPDQDNHGFARWVAEHAETLRDLLGPGRHFGEWWGAGIQRRYGLDHKRFSLFNAARWAEPLSMEPAAVEIGLHVVPVLAMREDILRAGGLEAVMAELSANGSYAAPGFMDPEGIVVFHMQSQQAFKWTFEGDASGKGKDQMAGVLA